MDDVEAEEPRLSFRPDDRETSSSSRRSTSGHCFDNGNTQLEHCFKAEEKVSADGLRNYVQKFIKPEINSIVLSMAGCASFDTLALLVLAYAFPPELRVLKLDMSGCTDIDNEGLSGLSKRIPATLETFVLNMSSLEIFRSTMQISDEGFYAVTQFLPRNLRHLELHFGSCARIGNQSILGLAEKLPTSLNVLELTFTGCPHIDDKGILGLSKALPADLRCFCLNCFGCKEVGDVGLISLAKHLPKELTALSLNFRCCDKISNAGIVGLTKILPHALLDASLDFGFCDIDDSLRERMACLESLRTWQHAMQIQDEAKAYPEDSTRVAAVAELLSHEDWLVRKGAVEVLGTFADAAHPHLPAIVQLLNDEECLLWPVAAEALCSLGVVGPSSSRASVGQRQLGRARAANASFISNESSDNGPLRTGIPEGDLDRMISGLADYLTDEEDGIRKAAAEALCLLGAPSAPHVDALARCLSDDDEDVRSAAAKAFGRLGSAAVPYASKLANCLADEEMDVRKNAAESLGMMGAASGPFTEALVKQLKEKDRDRRLSAMEVLCSMGQAATPHVGLVAKCFADQDWKVRMAAAKTMGHLSSAAAPFADQLALLVDDRDLVGPRQIDVGREVREAAADALCQLPMHVLESISIQTLALMTVGPCRSHSPDLAKRADEILRRKGDAEYAKVVAGLLRHEDWRTRVGSVEVLSRLGAAMEPYAGALTECLEDNRLNVRVAAADALLKLPLPQEGKDNEMCRALGLVAFSEHGDPKMACRAKVALQSLSNVQRATALARLIDHMNMKVRKGAVEAFGQLGEAAVPHAVELVRRLGDERAVVQKAAVATLDLTKEYVAQAPPVMSGHLWKQSPSKLRLGAYQRRWIMVRDARIFWWSSSDKATQNNAPDGGPLCKGHVDLRTNPCVVEVAPNPDITEGPSQRFVLRPADGQWTNACFTGAHKGREFFFDAKDSEFVAQGWIYVLRAHMSHAKQDFRKDLAAKSRPKTERSASCLAPDDKRRQLDQVRNALPNLSRAKSASSFDDPGSILMPAHWRM